MSSKKFYLCFILSFKNFVQEIENQPRLKNFNLHLILTCDLCTQAETLAILQSNWENREHQKYFWNVIVL